MANRSRNSVHDRTGDRPRQSPGAGTGTDAGTAIDRLKRAGAALLGIVLLVRGLGRRSLRGTVTALVGGWLLYRAIGGRSRIERTLGSRTPSGGRGDEDRPIGGREEEDRAGTADSTEISRTITIGKPPEELYEQWRDPDQFSQIMGHFADVNSTDGDRFRWTVGGPGDREVSWETRIVEEEPGEFIRWESPGDAMLPNEGTVRFRPAPGDRGTTVTLTVDFDPPGGALGTAALQRLDLVPKTLAGTALRRFKSLVESGEIQTLAGNPSARGEGDLL